MSLKNVRLILWSLVVGSIAADEPEHPGDHK